MISGMRRTSPEHSFTCDDEVEFLRQAHERPRGEVVASRLRIVVDDDRQLRHSAYRLEVPGKLAVVRLVEQRRQHHEARDSSLLRIHDVVRGDGRRLRGDARDHGHAARDDLADRAQHAPTLLTADAA